LVVDASGGWSQLTNEFGFGSERVPVLAGENTEIGELRVEPAEE